MPELTPRATGEAGIAMLAAVGMIVVIGIVTSVAMSASGVLSREVTDSARRSGAMVVAEGAAQAISQSLQSRGDVLGDGFDVTPQVIRDAAVLAGGTVVGGDAGGYAFPTSGAAATPVPLRFTVRDTSPEGYPTFWQVLSVIRPSVAATPPRTHVTVYVRAWIGEGAAMSRAAVVKARYRPGTFFDYQVISDVSIQFEPGTNLTGNVHTNGFIDDTLLPRGTVYDRIWTRSGTATCTTPAGGTRPVVSTAQGRIANIDPATCTSRANTGESISLARAASSFRAIQANCGTAGSGVRCYATTLPATARYSVDFSTTPVQVRLNGVLQAGPPAPNGSQGRALLFDRDVTVRGTATGRWTIATRSRTPAIPATDIRIIGNTTVATPGAAAPNALALIAENDIVLDTSSGCFSTVRAALVAVTGAVTLPREHRSSILPAGASLCPSISLTGALASHASIILRWSVGAASIGFGSRTYNWDPWLAYYPPPFVPLSHPWEMSGLEVANGDCFNSALAGSSACA